MRKSLKKRESGKVYLVGAGPGDIGLLTLKGKEYIEKADVIIYDYLANEEILSFARPDTERIFMGKHGGGPIMPQKETNRLMVAKAREGKRVVRLKGGDPFIFGRGGEEAEFLVKNRIPFEVVPGITAGSSVPAYAGIPLTHRSFSSSVAFITGHEDTIKKKSSIAWDKIATGVDTIVIFMGITTLPVIADRLIRNGKSPDTPAAVIQWGTTERQRTVTGSLRNIVHKTKVEDLRPPGIIIIGEVVKLRMRLKWFEEIVHANISLQYTTIKSGVLGTDVSIVATPKGICRITFGDASSLRRQLGPDYPNAVLSRDDRYFIPVLAEMDHFLEGGATQFTCPLDLQGTPFQKKVWKALLRIPFGKTASYQKVADMIGQPRAARAVGTACGQNPIPIIIPCHRVISSSGGLGGYSGGIAIKKALLRLEGIEC